MAQPPKHIDIPVNLKIGPPPPDEAESSLGTVHMDAAPFQQAVDRFDEITSRLIAAMAISAEIYAMDAANASSPGPPTYGEHEFIKRAIQLKELAR